MSIARILERFDASVESFSSGRQMPAKDRMDRALRVLAGGNVTRLAAESHVSRQFLYDQEKIAVRAIDSAFVSPIEDDDKVLFTVQFTKGRIKQIVLALVLRCHSSLRGVIAFFADVFDFDISLGGVHNIIADAMVRAQKINQADELGAIRIGAHDEIYQASHPVLVGLECASTYCYLLEAAEHCDPDTWGYHLLTAKDRGLSLDYVISDQGGAQRAGLAEAFPGVSCGIDAFHILRDFTAAITSYETIFQGKYTARLKVDAKMEAAYLRGGKLNKYSFELAGARARERSLEALVDDMTTLFEWLKDDVLAIAGMTAIDRSEMYDFVVAELKRLEPKRSKVRWLRRRLEKAKADLLGFTYRVDRQLEALASEMNIEKTLLDRVSRMLARHCDDPQRYEFEAELRRALRGRFYEVVTAVVRALKSTPRASSLVENLNSILRNYFFLRREVSGDYLALLRFYLNHRVIVRSEREERQGKTPKQLLTGKEHAHWLTMLGFTRSQRAA